MKKNVPGQPSFACSLLAGGIAGTTVDVALFPLDTIKTRMQAPTGFRNAGGFRGVYSGLSSAAAGSAPTAALFFTTYEVVKAKLAEFTPGSTDVDQAVSSHIAAASLAEAGACLVRVPTENVKQKLQVGYFTHTGACIRGIIASDGARGFFRGYWATIAREVPFSGIQFPIYERLKLLRAKQKGCAIDSVDAALCGSIAVRQPCLTQPQPLAYGILCAAFALGASGSRAVERALLLTPGVWVCAYSFARAGGNCGIGHVSPRRRQDSADAGCGRQRGASRCPRCAADHA